MELQVINTEGKKVDSLAVSDDVFARAYNEALVHQVVNAFMANARVGSRAQKTRSEVSKSTRKPFRQKGTGRARAGMASSPLWRGGGRIFPNRPDENFSQKVNRKMYRAGLATILSQLVRDERLIVADSINVTSPKTKGFVSMLNGMSLANDKVLFVVDELSEELYLASRNLTNVLVLEAQQVDPYSLLRFNKVVMMKNVVEQLQGQLV
jgi:large subunit ribosomal protein L4